MFSKSKKSDHPARFSNFLRWSRGDSPQKPNLHFCTGWGWGGCTRYDPIYIYIWCHFMFWSPEWIRHKMWHKTKLGKVPSWGTRSCPTEKRGTNHQKMNKAMLFDGFIFEKTLGNIKETESYQYKWSSWCLCSCLGKNCKMQIYDQFWYDHQCNQNEWLTFESKCRPQIPNVSFPQGHVNSIC